MVSDRKNSTRLPKLTLHKASGQGVVRLGGKDVYCGPYGTPECSARYFAAIAEWEARGRRPAAPAMREPAGAASDLTINELLVAYRRFAASYYVKDGKPTTEQRDIQLSFRPLRDMFGHELVAEFTPAQLKAVRQAFIDAALCRNEVNKRTRRLIRIFGWGVEEGLVPAAVHWGLKAVKGIRRGRADVRESAPVRPVPDEVVDATLPYLSPQVRAMVQIQRLTGMRPQEICLMRTVDLDASGPVIIYTPGRHKRQHHRKARTIPIGPRARAILEPWLRPSEPAAFLFSPRDAVAHRRAEMRRNRKTPVQPSQRDRRKARPRRAPGDHYQVSSYDHAIARGIRRANEAARRHDRPEIPHWHPNQLRHAAGTRIRREFGLDVARAVLGHSSPVVTEQYYAELDMGKAAEAMQRLG